MGHYALIADFDSVAMAKRGPKPLPTKILKVRGSRHLERRRDYKRPKSEIPAMPDSLSTDAKKIWNRVVLVLAQNGLLTQLDGDVLGAYCETVAEYWQALKFCKNPLLKTKAGNIIQNPAIGIKNKARDAMVKIAAQFGMTPSARSSLAIEPKSQPENKAKSPFKIA